VAITRAKEELTLVCAGRRTLFGRTSSNQPSRFVREIPPECLDESGRSVSASARREYAWEDDAAETKPEKRPERRDTRTASHKKPAFSAPAPAAPSAAPSFRKGDMVEHRAFGRGMVTLVQPMGGDALLEVAFDEKGTKRLMAKAAALQMKKL
jgi:DNA helicase-2/ATP-dependent DNA helicase PcrA